MSPKSPMTSRWITTKGIVEVCQCTMQPNHNRSSCECACHGDRATTSYDLAGDFEGRLGRAERALDDLAASEPSGENAARLRGKAEGVRLALGYFEEMRRAQS